MNLFQVWIKTLYKKKAQLEHYREVGDGGMVEWELFL